MNPPRRSGSSRKGFAQIIRGLGRCWRGRGGRGSALILGQRPTSPKGVQCYVGPLAHCGSHCCANCITTGSGRDLPSVARNSVSRGLVPGAAQCNSNGTTSNTDVRRRRRATFYGRRNVHRITGRYTSHQCRGAVRPRPCYVCRPCSKRVPFRVLHVGERKLIAPRRDSPRVASRRQKTRAGITVRRAKYNAFAMPGFHYRLVWQWAQ